MGRQLGRAEAISGEDLSVRETLPQIPRGRKKGEFINTFSRSDIQTPDWPTHTFFFSEGEGVSHIFLQFIIGLVVELWMEVLKNAHFTHGF